jgi:molybdopterin-guanine dinucleotide biosynthesis protein A
MTNQIKTIPPINGLILVGGKSSRMGKDKSLISFHRKPQREFLYELLTSFCNAVFLSGKDDQSVPSNFNFIPDKYTIESPLNGILSAFDRDANVAWLTIAVDMPMIDAKTITYLIQNRDVNKLATCFFDSEGVNPEPLFTLWEPSCYASLKDFFSNGNISPRRFLKQSDIKIIPIQDQRALTNINSEDELKKFITENKGNS